MAIIKNTAVTGSYRSAISQAVPQIGLQRVLSVYTQAT
ncbi:hypothetical protein VQ7734_00702 [Vibrio quintilis]|uniref:Uncharacterized protein n=1 Tax=Vibrio quintilis TaxID=1117707 RepID=A0A1M7YQR7_9VIBR|nr:hypothetical protein VQ7734_00702 [Vibrio quintilis]